MSTATTPTRITVHYEAIDGFRQTRTFKTLAGARKYVQRRVGAHPTSGGWYLVSDDGVGRVMVEGASYAALFPAGDEPPAPLPEDPAQPGVCRVCGGTLVVLGALGRVAHFRCRDCGADHAVDDPALARRLALETGDADPDPVDGDEPYTAPQLPF